MRGAHGPPPTVPRRAGYANPHGVAVIIGNRAYRNERVPEVAYAHRDAEAFRRFVLDVLGFDPGNVIDLRDATQSQMEDAFGNERSHEGRVWRYLHPRHGSDVVVFYSGHGVPGLDDGRGYLLPVDADPDSAKINGYPLDVLYSNLGKLEAAKSVRLYLDACFSGESDRGMLIRSASPVYVQASLPAVGADKLTVLAAASGKEVASWDEEAEHGLFTHHLLDALYGAGDADGDGQVTAAEAKTYLDDTMTIAARREFGRHQNASLNGVAGMVLARVEAGGAFPPRPALEVGNDERGPGPVDPASSVARDKYLLGLDKAFESGDHPKMLEFIGMLEGLGGPLPASVEYYRGEAEFHTDRSGKAVRSLRRYIEREGREGQHYRRSLELLLLLDARDDEAYARAQSTGTATAFGEYLSSFPDGRHHADAARQHESALRAEAAAVRAERERREAERRRADDDAFARAKRLNTPSSYQTYLDRGGRHESEARTLRDQRSREEAAAREAERRRQAEARRRADDEAFARAKRLNTSSSYQAYLDRGGRHESEARVLRDQRRREEAERRRQAEARRRADDEAFARAKRLNTPSSYQAYLDRGGRHESEARTLRDQRRREEAAAREAERRRQAEARRRADDEAAARARRSDTVAGYEAYLSSYPQGRHAEEVQGLLARALSRKWSSGTKFRDCPDCPEMVVIPAGSYLMGSPRSERSRRDNEGPLHRVTIGAPFGAGVYEVTRGEWSRFLEESGSSSDTQCTETRTRTTLVCKQQESYPRAASILAQTRLQAGRYAPGRLCHLAGRKRICTVAFGEDGKALSAVE